MRYCECEGLNRDQFVKIARLHRSNNFVAKREKLIFNMFSYLKASAEI